MKVIIQIPSFNEAEQLPKTLAVLPRSLPGVDAVEWLVIDDGSSDGTVSVARRAGAHHVLCLPAHRGLAAAFVAGLERSIRCGADIVVNTDADNQYCAEDIPALLAPLMSGDADLVIGARPIEAIEHFSPAKKWLQRIGSRVVRMLSGVDVSDATSGFRAYSRSAAVTVDVFSKYTYTLETLIQAGQSGLRVVSVPVRVNPAMRPSRLARSSAQYVWQSALTILRTFVIYRPFRFFMAQALVAIFASLLIGMRFLYYYAMSAGAGHVQSLILAAILFLTGVGLAGLGLIADLLSVNRRLLQRMQTQARYDLWMKP
jgi:glycosyltransferase involved in cell wall biosynthesis